MAKKLPTQLDLIAIHENWLVEYQQADQSRATITHPGSYRLLVKSPKLTKANCINPLKKWLKRKGERHLRHWMRAISDDVNLPFSDLSIRGQRARWGSCSEDSDINLNYKLLFMPAPIVQYILVHELCHTVELNHSEKFWELVAQHEPEYTQKIKTLRQLEIQLPSWLE